MKKYFVSYWFMTEGNRSVFGDAIKTSLNKNITVEELRTWKKEIKNGMRPLTIKKITIINFKEMK